MHMHTLQRHELGDELEALAVDQLGGDALAVALHVGHEVRALGLVAGRRVPHARRECSGLVAQHVEHERRVEREQRRLRERAAAVDRRPSRETERGRRDAVGVLVLLRRVALGRGLVRASRTAGHIRVRVGELVCDALQQLTPRALQQHKCGAEKNC